MSRIKDITDEDIDYEIDYFKGNWYKNLVGICYSSRDKKTQKLKLSWRRRKFERYYGRNVDTKLFLAKDPGFEDYELVEYKKNLFKEEENRKFKLIEALERKKKEKQISKKKTNFWKFRKFFMERFYSTIDSTFGYKNYEIKDIIMSKEIQDRFLFTLYNSDFDYLLGYHGTKKKNFNSIEDKGLLIPLRNKGINIENGAAHGVGIYTSKEESAWLSLNFNDNDTLIGCAIINDKYKIRDIYDARVIFNENLIIPMMYIKYKDSNLIYQNKGKMLFNISRINYGKDIYKHTPNNKPLWVGKRRRYIEECDEIVWLPASGVWYERELRFCKINYLNKLRNLEKNENFINKYFE